MTTNDFIRAVLAELPPIPDDERAEAEAAIMAATYAGLSRLAALDAAAPRDARRFEKTFELAADAGDCPLADALAEGEPLIPEFFSNCSVYITGSDYAVPPASDRGRQALATPGRCSYVLEDLGLRIYGPDGPYTGAVTLRKAPHVPALESVAPPQDDALVKIVAAAVAPPAKPKPNRPKGTVTT